MTNEDSKTLLTDLNLLFKEKKEAKVLTLKGFRLKMSGPVQKQPETYHPGQTAGAQSEF